MMEQDIRKAVLHLDPLKSVVKTELILQNGTHEVKHIPGDALVNALKAYIYAAPMKTGLLPPGVIALTAYQDGWDVTLENITDCCTVYYHKTAYPDFPLPHLLLRCRVKNGILSRFQMAVADEGALSPESRLYRCPFPNVRDFSLCVGSNQFTGYDTLWKLRGLMHYYQPDSTKLKLPARELFEHLKDKTPSYYYSDVLLLMGKNVTDFIGG